MEKSNENILHLGADLDRDFVLRFREYCRSNDFKQKTLIQRLVEWWLGLDPISQEHVYRGRMNEMFAFEDEAAAAREIAKKKHKKSRRPSVAG